MGRRKKRNQRLIRRKRWRLTRKSLRRWRRKKQKLWRRRKKKKRKRKKSGLMKRRRTKKRCHWTGMTLVTLLRMGNPRRWGKRRNPRPRSRRPSGAARLLGDARRL